MHHTVLLCHCQTDLNRDDPAIRDRIGLSGCPPRLDKIGEALGRAGISVDPKMFEDIDQFPSVFMNRYKDRPEFSLDFFRIDA